MGYIQGRIRFKDEDTFNKAVFLLGRYCVDGYFVDNTLTKISTYQNIDYNNRIIDIPFFHYDNLLLDILGVLFKDGNRNTSCIIMGKVIWTSNDGIFLGGIIANNSETCYNLEDWAKEHIKEEKPEDEWDDWQVEVETEFFDWAKK
jgi:hypothetical protein